MLEIGIEEDEVVPIGDRRRGHDAFGLSEIAAVADHLEGLPPIRFAFRDVGSPVGRSIVHEDDLAGQTMLLPGRPELPDKIRDDLGFVEGRHHEREVRTDLGTQRGFGSRHRGWVAHDLLHPG